jgi:hypothetical protein
MLEFVLHLLHLPEQDTVELITNKLKGKGLKTAEAETMIALHLSSELGSVLIFGAMDVDPGAIAPLEIFAFLTSSLSCEFSCCNCTKSI